MSSAKSRRRTVRRAARPARVGGGTVDVISRTLFDFNYAMHEQRRLPDHPGVARAIAAQEWSVGLGPTGTANDTLAILTNRLAPFCNASPYTYMCPSCVVQGSSPLPQLGYYGNAADAQQQWTNHLNVTADTTPFGWGPVNEAGIGELTNIYRITHASVTVEFDGSAADQFLPGGRIYTFQAPYGQSGDAYIPNSEADVESMVKNGLASGPFSVSELVHSKGDLTSYMVRPSLCLINWMSTEDLAGFNGGSPGSADFNSTYYTGIYIANATCGWRFVFRRLVEYVPEISAGAVVEVRAPPLVPNAAQTTEIVLATAKHAQTAMVQASLDRGPSAAASVVQSPPLIRALETGITWAGRALDAASFILPKARAAKVAWGAFRKLF